MAQKVAIVLKMKSQQETTSLRQTATLDKSLSSELLVNNINQPLTNNLVIVHWWIVIHLEDSTIGSFSKRAQDQFLKSPASF